MMHIFHNREGDHVSLPPGWTSLPMTMNIQHWIGGT
jgi:hypothetical protein